MDELRDRAKAKEILEFWHTVEFFVPYDLDRVAESASQSSWLSKDATGFGIAEELPWALRAREGVAFQLYLGVFDSGDVTEVCKQVGLEEDRPVRQIDNQERGSEARDRHTCFAKIRVGPDGIVDWRRCSVSTLPWALRHLKEGKLRELSSSAWETAKFDLGLELENFASSLKNGGEAGEPGEPRALSGRDVVRLSELLYEWAGYWPDHRFFALLETVRWKLSEREPKANGGAGEPAEEADDEEETEAESTGIDILNSFYLEDLEEAIRACEAGDPHLPIDLYLRAESDRKVNVYSQEGREAILKQVRPPLMTAGRWLETPERMMSLMQQFAINSAFERLAESGLYAVNGPPGTGKTTMLREMVAENVVRRARALAELPYPRAAWKERQRVSFPKGGAYVIGIPKDSLTGFEMVVASSNNTAVENISKELPSTTSRAEPWENVQYLLPVARNMFAQYRRGKLVPLKGTETPWGLVSGVLGKKANRSRMVSRLVFDADAGDQREARRAAGEYLNIRDWAAGYSGPSFQAARTAFQEIDIAVRQRLTELEELVSLQWETSDEAMEDCCRTDAEALAKAEIELRTIGENKASVERQMATLENELKQREREELILRELKGERKKWWAFFSAGGTREQERKLHDNLAVQLRLSEEVRERREELRAILSAQYDKAAKELAAVQERSAQRKIEIEERRTKLLCLREDFAGLGQPASLDDLEKENYQKDGLWQDQNLNQLRSDLFAASLQLHESWLASVLRKGQGFRPNVIAIAKLLDGKLPQNPEHVLAIWQSLFLIVPVISSTFASFQRQFRGLPAKSLGWLFVDEAGQAVPQAAVGALRKARRALVIGDPMQIEPIFEVPIKLVEQLAKGDDHLIQKYAPHQTSVQVLADNANEHGAYVEREEQRTWIGSPLRVHRRCSDPMFRVANRIAYQNTMIRGKAIRGKVEPSDRAEQRSQWFDVRGAVVDRQYVPAQGRFVADQIAAQYLRNSNRLPAVYIISPFRRVAERIRALLLDEEEWRRRLKGRCEVPKAEDLRLWVTKRVGTVHTFQGKEEEAAFFVLGADRQSPGSVAWAAAKPNLLNVALTRAKEHIYIVGDRDLWGSKRFFVEIADQLKPAPSSHARGQNGE